MLGPDAEQHAAVSADHWAGVEDEGGAVQAEVEVGGDRHQQRALSAVQVLNNYIILTRAGNSLHNIQEFTKTPMTSINVLLNMHVST